MIVSEYIADFLVKKGIKDVFLLDGSACASIIVAVARNKKLKYYCPLHEQAGSFAADGYFKATRKMTTMIATSGPGGQNLLNGIAASYYDSCPAFYITGQINSRFIKTTDKIRQVGFQENDIVSMAKPVAKYAVLIKSADDIAYELEKAYHLAVSGRPGPVLLDIPMDIQNKQMPENFRVFIPEEKMKNETEKIPEVLKMLYAAQRPVILLGGGVWLADVVPLARKLSGALKKVPFLVTWNMIDYYDPKYYAGRVGTFGGEGRNFTIQNSDFLLAIGSRISGRITGGMVDTFARAAQKVVVDIDKEEMAHQQIKANLNIYCDAKVFIQEVLGALDTSHLSCPSSWLKKALFWKNKYGVVKKEYWKQKGSVNPYVFVKTLSSYMEKGDILVHEAGGNCVVTSQTFEAKPNQRVFSNNGNSSLGYALPAAIGACIAAKRKVNCITGDGGLNFNIQELQTIKHYSLPVKVLIFNNQAFGITKAYRDTNFNSEYAGVDADHGLSSPDFIKIARAYGIKAVKIHDHNELNRKIKKVLAAEEPVICDINMKGFYEYQPKLGWRQPIEDQYPFLPRNEFRENMMIGSYPGWEDPKYP